MVNIWSRPAVRIDAGQGIVYEGTLRSFTRDAPIFDGDDDRYDLTFHVERVLLDRRFSEDQVSAFGDALRQMYPDVRVLREVP